MKKILLTGAAGFIGSNTASALLRRGDVVIGVDNLNDYYDVSLKQGRLDQLLGREGFRFVQMDLRRRFLSSRTAPDVLDQLRRLADLGIDRSRLTTVSYGEERPVAYGSGESNWSQNRRVELK